MVSPKVTVAYRAYPVLTKPAPIEGINKKELFTLCLESFIASLGPCEYRIIMILDGTPDTYERTCAKLIPSDRLSVVRTDRIGNLSTFALQLETLSNNTTASEFVYFAEDDYFYVPTALQTMIEFAESSGAHFITPYDHPDYYRLKMHRERVVVKSSCGMHWRTCNSTCMTFLARRSALCRYQRAFGTYKHRNQDASLWFQVTKGLGMFDPRFWARMTHTPAERKILLKTLLFSALARPLWRPASLWCPIPGLAVHMESQGVSSGRAWHSLWCR